MWLIVGVVQAELGDEELAAARRAYALQPDHTSRAGKRWTAQEDQTLKDSFRQWVCADCRWCVWSESPCCRFHAQEDALEMIAATVRGRDLSAVKVGDSSWRANSVHSAFVVGVYRAV